MNKIAIEAVGYTVVVISLIVLSPPALYYYCSSRFLSDKTLFKAYQNYPQYNGVGFGALLNDIKNECHYKYAKNNMHRIERYFLLL